MSDPQNKVKEAEALLNRARLALMGSTMSRTDAALVEDINVFLNPPSLDSVSLERLQAFKARLASEEK